MCSWKITTHMFYLKISIIVKINLVWNTYPEKIILSIFPYFNCMNKYLYQFHFVQLHSVFFTQLNYKIKLTIVFSSVHDRKWNNYVIKLILNAIWVFFLFHCKIWNVNTLIYRSIYRKFFSDASRSEFYNEIDFLLTFITVCGTEARYNENLKIMHEKF